MAFRISGAAIRRPMPSMVLFAVLLVLGIIAFRDIPITLSPNIDIPVVSVVITQSGAAPADLEAQVTKKVEDAIANVQGVKHITSSVTDGSSSTGVEFRLEVNTDRALNDVRDAVAKIRADLPQGIDEPIIERIDVVGQAIQTWAASAPTMTPEQLSWFIDDTVIRELTGVRGVGRVGRVGGVTREVQVNLAPDRLASLGITAADVNRQVFATSVDLAGGRAELGHQEQAIRTLAASNDVAGLAATRIGLPGGRELRLGELAEVADRYEEPRGFARLDGQTPVVALAVYRSKGASDVSVAEAVAARLQQIAAAHPAVSFRLVDDSVRATYGGYLSAMHSLIEGAVLATLVVLLFLRDWRATLLAAVALPLSIIPAFAAMDLMGFSFNFISLLAITLVTGILVDDAIVEIENIVRHIRMGKPAWQAAIDAADEIGLAVIAITLTIVAVFAPVSFMGGIPGQYFKQFGLTVAAAVLVSLAVARLVTPVMAAYLLRGRGHGTPHDNAALRLYSRFLQATVARPAVTLTCGVVLFALSIWSTTLLPTGFLPPEDHGRTVISLEVPPGATLEDTERKTDTIARLVHALPEVRSVMVVGGASPTGTSEVRRASMLVTLVPKEERARSQKQVEAALSDLLARVPDLRGWYVNERGERELALSVVGNDGAALDRGVGALTTAMRRLPGFTNVAESAGVARPEIRILPRLDESARFGVSTQTISEAVRVATIGDINANLAKMRVGDRLIPIRVQVDPVLRRDVAAIGTLPVTGRDGLAVPLSAVADIELGQGPSSIERYDRVRRVTIGADLQGLPLGQAVAAVDALPQARNLPPGVAMAQSGDVEIMAEVFSGFALAMGTGLMIVLAVLVLLFGNLFQPLTVLLSLPLCLGGVILALLLTHQPISLPVAIGILMLMGIVTKNAIMLVDFAIERQRHGIAPREAILDAGRKRAQPIVMTTIAMVAGMVPSALGLGDGGEFRSPMAVGVIGGLIVSTVLSLVFVPSVYVLMESLSRVTGRLAGRLIRAERDVPAPLPTTPALSIPEPATGPARERQGRLPRPIPAAE